MSEHDKEQHIKDLREKVQALETIINESRGQNETVKKALVDIAVALEKIANIEERVAQHQQESREHSQDIQNIKNRLPVIEQTFRWINAGIIGVVGLMGTIFVIFLINNIGNASKIVGG